MVLGMNKAEIVKCKDHIRKRLNEIAIERGDLLEEYRQLNTELGRIEYAELNQQVVDSNKS
jgi:hypothetical protein